jgi:hypothetical protein
LDIACCHRQFVEVREESGEKVAREHSLPQFMPAPTHALL